MCWFPSGGILSKCSLESEPLQQQQVWTHGSTHTSHISCCVQGLRRMVEPRKSYTTRCTWSRHAAFHTWTLFSLTDLIFACITLTLCYSLTIILWDNEVKLKVWAMQCFFMWDCQGHYSELPFTNTSEILSHTVLKHWYSTYNWKMICSHTLVKHSDRHR